MKEWHEMPEVQDNQRNSKPDDCDPVSPRSAKPPFYEVNRRISQVIEFLPDPTFAIDGAGRVIFWNRPMEEMTGVRSEDILGKSDYEYALSFYGERRPLLIDLVMKRDDEVEKKYASTRWEGGSLYAEAVALPGKRMLWGKASPMYDDQGKLIGAIESIRDVTENKAIERAHKDAVKQVVQITDFLPDPTFAVDLEKKVILWNKAMERFTGIKARDILHSVIHEKISSIHMGLPLLVDLVMNPDLIRGRKYTRIKNSAGILSYEGPINFRGEKRHVWAQASPILDSQGNMVGAVETTRDISVHVAAQKQLTREKDFCLSLIETSPAFFTAIGKQGETIWMNRAMLFALGYSIDEVVGKPYVETFVPPEDRRGVIEDIEKLHASQKMQVHENLIVAKNGSTLDVQ